MPPPPLGLPANVSMVSIAPTANASITPAQPHTRPIPVAETTCWTYASAGALQVCCAGNGTSWTSQSASGFNKTHKHAEWINGNLTGAHRDTIYACTIPRGRDFKVLHGVGGCLISSLNNSYTPPAGGDPLFPEHTDQWRCEYNLPSAASSASHARVGVMALLVVLASAVVAL
ncbi:uncharacterized protein LOC62_02G001896 [Vanrija pseudolonga]|uniref:Uncharacterized protein n=1 Tax=Vanrija pseudolonga TaxID=143232 RepID=A0AAF0Y1I1_9TREE|nr:hypothetical protein LOC62_02G001896 [Vanrija pseudolonga]